MDFLPMPHSVRKGEGLFPLRYDTRIVLENTEPSAFLYAQMLQADVQRFTGLKPAILRGNGPAGRRDSPGGRRAGGNQLPAFRHNGKHARPRRQR